MEYVERKSNLVVPEGFVELDREEMTYVDGGGIVSIYVQFSLGAAVASFGASFVSAFAISYFTVKIGKSVPILIGKLIGAAIGATLGTALASAINAGSSMITIPVFYMWIPFVSYSHTFDLGNSLFDVINSITGGGLGGGLGGALASVKGASMGAAAGAAY